GSSVLALSRPLRGGAGAGRLPRGSPAVGTEATSGVAPASGPPRAIPDRSAPAAPQSDRMPTRDAPGPRASRPVNACAILGLLSSGTELTGYQLRQWAENVLGFFHSVPAMSQIYTELRRLERHGYVLGSEEEAPGGRARRSYRITPAGRAALACWIDEEPVEPPTVRNGAMLRLWLGAHASPERLRGILREHRDRSEAMRA